MEYLIDTKNNPHTYADEIKRSYTRDEFSDNVLEWNKIRAMCIDLMLNKFLYPKFQRELEEALLDESRQYVIKQCSTRLHDWIKIAPYRLSNDENVTSISDAGVRVLSIVYSTDPDDVSFAVILSSEGQVMDFIRLPNLMLRENYSTDNRLKKDKDFQAIKAFIIQRVPDVICIGVESRDALYLQTRLKDMVSQIQHDEEQFQNLPAPIEVLLVDTELSKIYAQSRKGEADFRDYPVKLRQAVSQARRLQDPLLEFSQLFNYDKEILLIKFHPLQDLIDREQLLSMIEKLFISRTNEVGVDLNRCITYPHTSNVLQFVCGLGPRKATHLIKYFKQNNLQLENRTFLVVNYQMGKCVFSNCAGFIKINTDAMKQSDSYIEILDSTRIHPEAYDWARKMAVDALDIEESSEMEPSAALEEIFQNSERLKDLDLDAFAVELKNTMYGDQSITLYDIRAELTHRYKDVRIRYEPPSPEDLFHFITKETPATFHLGKLIQCQVFDFARKQPTPDQLEAAQPLKDEATGILTCPLCQTERFYTPKEVRNEKLSS
jgi:transcription elongation factor SPT6